MTDPTITIAGLRAQVDSLETSLRAALDDGATSEEVRLIREAERAAVAAERDALAAQLAEVRAELAKAPKVCAIHSYEHGPGPCMTCGAWPPGTRELIATCRARIAGLEQAADERSAEVARLTARVAELEARPVLTVERLTEALAMGETAGAFLFSKLGPVTLPPAQDRAEELANAYVDEWNGRSDCRGDAQAIARRAAAMRRALASLGAPPTSPGTAAGVPVTPERGK